MTERMASNDEIRRPKRDPEPPPGPERRKPWANLELSAVLPGLVIAGLGIIFLLDNLDIVETWDIVRFWPLLLVAVGVQHLFQARDRGTAVSGTLWAGAGGLLLLSNLDLIDFSLWDLWPLLLVAIGVRMLAHVGSGSRSPAAATDADESCHAFLGSVQRRNRSANFRGGSASAFMGGVELDLREADLAGDEAVIRVFAMWGGIEIRIPEEWTAEVRAVQIMGGVEDKTRGPAAVTKRLVLDGSVVMGGVEIKN